MPPHAPSAGPVGRFRTDLQALTGQAPGRIGIAVSGGPDSLALLLLACAAFPGTVQAATVDHGLRPESADEADLVARLCGARGIPHAVLKPGQPITGNLQSAARRVRYALLEAWRAEQGLDWILTAHHADDQAETLLMRLNRGSGVGGLAGIRAVNGRVLRPLLGWRRSELERIVAEAGIDAVADPSNRDERFDRARLRRALEAADWIDRPAIARSARALADAEEALDWAAERLAAERIEGDAESLQLDPADVPPELRRRLLLRALRRIDADAAPRGEELSRLLATLEQGGTATLSGVKAEGGETWRFSPAPPRAGSPPPRFARSPSPRNRGED
jgi:tRNA(Ile)-lysidine synthase